MIGTIAGCKWWDKLIGKEENKPASEPQPPITSADATGKWTAVLKLTTSNPGTAGCQFTDRTNTLDVAQTGNTFTATAIILSITATYTGTVDGLRYTGNTSYVISGWTVTSNFDVTLASNNSGSGTITDNLSSQSGACSAQWALTVTR